MVFKPRRSTGVLVGVAIILSILVLDALLLSYLRWSQISLVFFIFALLVILSLPLLALLGYLVYGLFNLRYRLHRDALTIVWGATQHIIPLDSIREVARGEDLGKEIKVRGISWPGYLVGRGQIEGIGRALFYATEPVAGQLLAVTPTVAYGISPADPDGFLDAFEIRQHMGPIQLLSYEHRQPGFLSWPLRRDRLAHLLLASGLGVNLILFGYHFWRYPALGQAEVFKLPAIGLVALIVNSSLGILIHRRQRVGAYLLWGGTIVVQLLSWLTAFNVIG
ncbi:MAG: PH domain-containing protein [Anaerolineae bacterium]